MKTFIAHALFNSYTYPEYRKLILDVSHQGKSTTPDSSEELAKYTALNETRMHRLDKTIKITEVHMVSFKRRLVWRCRSNSTNSK